MTEDIFTSVVIDAPWTYLKEMAADESTPPVDVWSDDDEDDDDGDAWKDYFQQKVC